MRHRHRAIRPRRSGWVHRIFHEKGSAGVATAVAIAFFGWLAFESWFLTGPVILNAPNHPLGVPVTFEVAAPGTSHAITIDRAHRRRGKKRLEWSVTGPDGGVLLEDRDAIPRASRMATFTPRSAGEHTLVVRRRGDVAAGGTVTLILTGEDRTLLLPVFDFFW